jgi:hypothetical protein
MHSSPRTEAASNARAPEGPLFRGSHAYAYAHRAADPTRGQSQGFGRSPVGDRKSAKLESRNDSPFCVCIQSLTESVYSHSKGFRYRRIHGAHSDGNSSVGSEPDARPETEASAFPVYPSITGGAAAGPDFDCSRRA